VSAAPGGHTTYFTLLSVLHLSSMCVCFTLRSSWYFFLLTAPICKVKCIRVVRYGYWKVELLFLVLAMTVELR